MTILNENTACIHTLWDLFDSARNRFKEREFLKGDRALTYGTAAREVLAIANEFKTRGGRPGDRLLICCEDKKETPLFLFAAARTGMVFSILHNSLKPGEIKAVKENFSPSIVVLDHSTLGFENLFRDCTIIMTDRQASQGKDLPHPPCSSLPEAESQGRDGPEIACVIYTTGSTGSPKGVCITHSNILFSIRQIQARLAYGKEDVIGLFLPLSFDYGMYQVFLAANSGAALYFGSNKTVSFRLLSEIKHNAITILPGVPSLISILMIQMKRTPTPLERLKSITNTGDVLPARTVERLYTLLPEVQVFLMYGLTECKRISILGPEEWEMRKGSVGRPLAGTRVFVQDDQGNIHDRDCTGELIVQGPHITAGYHKDKALTRSRFIGNGKTRELLTGDICRIDHEGYIYFITRKDRQMKHFGFRLEPAEIEKHALELAGVSHAALLQTKGPDTLHLFVSGYPGLNERDIMSGLKKILPPYKYPGQIYIKEKLPLNQNGKIDYTLLKQMIDRNHE